MYKLTKVQRLSTIIGISSAFFLAEISVGFYTGSLALVADAFHYLNDLIGFVVALVAFKVSERTISPPELSYGYQRATLLGAFFNGVFLLALGVSIFLQAIDRFVSVHDVDNPRLVLIIGCVGFALNVLSATILHEHEHDAPKVDPESTSPAISESTLTKVISPHDKHRHMTNIKNLKTERDLGIMGVLIHVMGDAANNVGVIISGAIIWKSKSPGRFYADPAISMAIALMILLTSMPIVRRSGYILLDSVPNGVDPRDVQYDIEQVPGVVGVHELHIRRLNQRKAIASAHIVTTETELAGFTEIAKTVGECFHEYGIHSVTLQPEAPKPVVRTPSGEVDWDEQASTLRSERPSREYCALGCRTTGCDVLACCD